MKKNNQILLTLATLVLFSLTGSAQQSAQQPAQSIEPGNPGSSFVIEVHGQGKPVVLIPGLSSSGDTWKTTVAHLQDHYTCYVITLAGFAGAPPIHPPLLATVRDDLAAYMKKHHLEKAAVIGHSLGGNLAMGLAARHPELVGSLVIVDSLPFYAGVWFQTKNVQDAKPNLDAMKSYMAQQTHEQYDAFVRAGTATKYMVTSPDDLQTIIQWGLASDQATVGAVMYEMLNEDLRPDLAHITSPTLVLGTWAGLRDQMQQTGAKITAEAVTTVFADQYARLPHMHFALAPTARHFIMWDDPQWFFSRLDSFLAQPVQVAQERGFSK